MAMKVLKESGVKWIGLAPVCWQVIPFKYCIDRRQGGDWGEDEISVPLDYKENVACIRVADFNFQQFRVMQRGEYTLRSYDKQTINKLLLKNGDVLVEKSGGGEKTPVGRSVLFDKKLKALYSNFLERFRVKEIVNPRYFVYCWNSFYRLGHTRLYIKQTTGIQNLDFQRILSQESMLLPNLDDQERIVSYLDENCQKIDQLINKIEKQIELLGEYKKSIITETVTKGINKTEDFKESRVSWLGTVPKHWKLSKVKYVAKFSPDTKKVGSGAIGYAPMECVKQGVMYPLIECIENLPSSLTAFQKGDIVIAKVTPCFENGNIAIVPEIPQDLCLGSSELFVFRTTGILNYYLFYYFQTTGFKEACASTMTGAGGLKRVSSYFIKDCVVPVPSIDEQIQIVQFLNNKCAQVDAVLAEKRKQLNVLNEYKRSFIFEAVAGKLYDQVA